MERTYDLFEIESGGVVRWRCAVTGHEQAIRKLRELAETTENEVRVMHVPTHSIVAVMNAKEEPPPR